jgi:hypothetical protein
MLINTHLTSAFEIRPAMLKRLARSMTGTKRNFGLAKVVRDLKVGVTRRAATTATQLANHAAAR